MADVVDLITEQHRRIDALLSQAAEAGPAELPGLLQQVSDLLLPHSQAEESFVYPTIADLDDAEDDEVKDGAAEHHHIEELLAELIAGDPAEPGFDGRLAALTGELRHHVEEEESELLPVLRDRADDEQRAELGRRFAEATGTSGDLDLTERPATSPTADVADLTKDELYEKAKQQQVPGRSSMTKEELAQAVSDE